MPDSIAMEIAEAYHVDVKILKLRGKLDASTAAAFEGKLNEVLTAGDPNLLLDLQNLETISSAGLNVLLSSNKRIRKKRGIIALSAVTNEVKNIFKHSGMFPLFPFYQDSEEALTNGCFNLP